MFLFPRFGASRSNLTIALLEIKDSITAIHIGIVAARVDFCYSGMANWRLLINLCKQQTRPMTTVGTFRTACATRIVHKKVIGKHTFLMLYIFIQVRL